MAQSVTTVPVKRDDSLCSDHFSNIYKKTKTPVILSSVTKNWPARQKWTLEYLQEGIGDVVVPVYSSLPAKDHSHQHAAARHITMREYLEMLKNGESNLRLFFYNILSGAPQLREDFRIPKIGFKFFKRLPVLFVGGRGAKVQMHYDIDLADLFLSHFGGRKRVYLFSPEQTKYLYKVPFSFSSLYDVDILNPDFERFPALKKVKAELAILEHGDTLYIPSGYWHYIVYDDIGFSLTLRSFPKNIVNLAIVAKNIFITRTVEGLMRKLIGQPWNTFNEKRAVEKTNKLLMSE